MRLGQPAEGRGAQRRADRRAARQPGPAKGLTPPVSRRLAAGIAALAIGFASAAAAQEAQVSVFGGLHLDNVWEEVFLQPTELEWLDSGLVGVAVGRDWQAPGRSLSYGVELQAVQQFGDQHHLEFNLPVFVRYHPPVRLPIRSLGFGVGPSYAAEVPEVEIERRGESRRFLIYWALEAEFGARDGRSSLFTRLHHRSGVFGLLSTEGASNAVVLGLRRRW